MSEGAPSATPPDLPFELHERIVYLPAADAIVLADLHLGRAAASSVEAPLGEGSDVIERFTDAIERFEPVTVVLAGDVLHSFSYVPRQVEETVGAIVDIADRFGSSLMVTPGNHDAMLQRVYDGETASAARLPKADTVVCHGHEEASHDGSLYIIGHVHPALALDGRKRPCFLYGPGTIDDSDVLILPAFTRLASGATVNRMHARDFQSPLVTDADVLRPVVWDDAGQSPLWFPPLGRCRSVL